MRPAFYALRGGGWRDWWTLLHPPYTLWHLSYVALGAAASPHPASDRLVATLVAFFLAVGLGAHALDELNGRPLGTAIGTRTLWVVAGASIAGAIGVGIIGIVEVGWTLAIFIAVGTFIVLAYNLEWFRGRFHSDLWFALAWGGFPAVTSAWVQSRPLGWEPWLVAAGCVMLSAAQRTLSTPVRAIRRRTAGVAGTIVHADGSTTEINASTLIAPNERALRALSVAIPLVALGAVIAAL